MNNNYLLEWARYLARGVEKKDVCPAPKKEDTMEGKEEEEKEIEVENSPGMKKIEIAIKNLGLTPFSTSIIIQYIKVIYDA